MPAELFDQFVAHGFLAFNAEGFLEGGDVEPDLIGGCVGVALSFDVFADHAGAVGDEAVDHSDVGAVDDAFDVVGEWDVLRHEDVGLDAGGSGVRGEGSGGVACGGDG